MERREKVQKSKVLGSVFAVLSLGFIALGTSGCGQGGTSMAGMLSTIQVSSYTQNGDLWTKLSAQLDTGNMILAGINVPIVDPKNPSVQYGQLSLNSNFCQTNSVCPGGGQLSISVNLSQVAHVSTVDGNLPNGTALPIGNAAQASVVGLAIGNTGARLYVGLGNGVALLGLAMPFKALDVVGQYAPGVDIFNAFTIQQVRGIIGIFTGATTNTTGLGLFVDLSNLLPTSPAPQPSSSVMAAQALGAQVRVASAESSSASIQAQPIDFVDVLPSSSDEQEVDYQLWRLNNQRVQLKLK